MIIRHILKPMIFRMNCVWIVLIEILNELIHEILSIKNNFLARWKLGMFI